MADDLDQALLATVADDDMKALDPERYECVLHDMHLPRPVLLHSHRVIPLSWTRALGDAASRQVPVCAAGHEQLHLAIRAYISGGYGPASPTLYPYAAEAVAYWERHEDLLAPLAGVDVVRRYYEPSAAQRAGLLGRLTRALGRG